MDGRRVGGEVFQDDGSLDLRKQSEDGVHCVHSAPSSWIEYRTAKRVPAACPALTY